MNECEGRGWAGARLSSNMLRSLNVNTGSEELMWTFELGRDRVTLRMRLLEMIEGQDWRQGGQGGWWVVPENQAVGHPNTLMQRHPL